MNIAIVAFSKPIVPTNSLEKRNADATHAHVVLTQLKSTTDSILPEISMTSNDYLPLNSC